MFRWKLLPGAAGMLMIIWGLAGVEDATRRWMFLAGAIGMTLTTLLERHRLFCGLQLIVLSGALAAFLPLPAAGKGLIPVAVCIPVLSLLAIQGDLRDPHTWMGGAALVALGTGYAIQHPLALLLGGFLVVIFSAGELRRGVQAALIWLVLNLIFTILAAMQFFT